jgi:type II secretory pathway component GspD/PulD (secretin)
MSRAIPIRIVGCLLILTCCWLSIAAGQDPTGKAAAGVGQPVKQVVYDVKHGVAKDLAELLGKLFKPDSGIQVLAAPTGNGLVLSGPADSMDELQQLVQQLDRRPRTVLVEVLIAEVPPPHQGPPGRPAPPLNELNPREFTGSADRVVARLQALHKKGPIGNLKQLRLSTPENQTGSVDVRGRKTYTTGIVTRNGVAKRTTSQRDLGTTIKATPRIGNDGRIVLDLHLTDTFMRLPEDGPPIGMDENGQIVRATTFVNTMFAGPITVRSGEAAVLDGVTLQGPTGGQQTLIVVTARIVESDAKGNK